MRHVVCVAWKLKFVFNFIFVRGFFRQEFLFPHSNTHKCLRLVIYWNMETQITVFGYWVTKKFSECSELYKPKIHPIWSHCKTHTNVVHACMHAYTCSVCVCVINKKNFHIVNFVGHQQEVKTICVQADQLTQYCYRTISKCCLKWLAQRWHLQPFTFIFDDKLVVLFIHQNQIFNTNLILS